MSSSRNVWACIHLFIPIGWGGRFLTESLEKELLIFVHENSSKLQKKANNRLYDLFKEYLSLLPTIFSMEEFLTKSNEKELLIFIAGNSSNLQKKAIDSLYVLFMEYFSLHQTILFHRLGERSLLSTMKRNY